MPGQAAVILRHRPDEGGASRAGGERFDVKINGEVAQLTVPPPSDSLVAARLPWLLNDRLGGDPSLEEDQRRASDVEAELMEWAEAAGGAIVDALKGVVPSSLNVELRSPKSAVARWPWEWIRQRSSAPIGATIPLWRSLSPEVLPAPVTEAPPRGPIRVLLVIARGAGPRAAGDVGYRNVAAPLIELAARYPSQLQVEILRRPCTLSVIRARLHDLTRPVHVLHIDGHGLEGTLCLEDGQFRRADVPPVELADAVTGAGLRAVVLNACHSAEGGSSRLDDLAMELHRRGVPAVLAMQAALRVDAAHIVTRSLYEELAQAGRVDLAAQKVRAALAGDRARHSQGRTFALPDWGVPVLYLHAGAEVVSELAGVAPTEVHLPQAPRRRRVPMDWMLLKLDQVLLHTPEPAVVLHGLRGSGKSALVQDALRWWEASGWLGSPPVSLDVVVGMAPAGPADEALARLRAAREALVPATSDGLRVLVWDDFDALRPWTWTGPERRAFSKEVEALADHHATLLIVSRDRLRWLSSAARLPMDGLCAREAREHGQSLARSRPDVQLGDEGVAQVIEEVLRHADQSPACLDAMFRATFQEGWSPRSLVGTMPSQLPDALLHVFEELRDRLEEAGVGEDLNALSSTMAGLEPGGLLLRVPRKGGHDDLLERLERLGALRFLPVRERPDERRYAVHPLLHPWLAQQPVEHKPMMDAATQHNRDAPPSLTQYSASLRTEAVPESRSPLTGVRLHLSGSADDQVAPPPMLERAHAFVRALVLESLKRGATWTLFQSAEDGPEWKPGLLWGPTQLSALIEGFEALSGPVVPLTAIANPRHAPERIQPRTREAFAVLDRRPGINWQWTHPDRHVGGRFRRQVADHTDVAVLLGGGRGTFDLHGHMEETGKPALPMDLHLGAINRDGKGAAQLFEAMLENPERFFPRTGRRALERRLQWSLRGAGVNVSEVACTVLDLIAAELKA